MYDIMNTTQSNYSNMLKRLQQKKSFSNFVITYYSIALIVYSLTAVFFPEVFDEKLSSYFNIILSIVVLTYSLIIKNSKYSERIQVKARKRELTDDNVAEKRREYEEVISKAEYRSEVDFFRTLKQKCKKNNIRLCHYRQDLGEMTDREEAKKLKEYLSENFPLTQQIKIIAQHIWEGIIILVPAVIFIVCFCV